MYQKTAAASTNFEQKVPRFDDVWGVILWGFFNNF